VADAGNAKQRASASARPVSSRLELPGLAPTTLGPGERFFADPKPGEDEHSFQVPNNSSAYFDSAYYRAHENDLQPVPAPRTTPSRIDLAEIVGTDVLAVRTKASKISFHAVGDSGAASEVHIDSEAAVADAMTRDLIAEEGADAPAFCFHLGDVIYYFGEPQYYYDQFYEPFRGYGAPIFAIPGNHDGFPEQGTASLFAFLRNFCTVNPEKSPDAQGLMRSTMTQPGVYFTLTAPFVSIVGLYSNVLEGPGVISSEGGLWPIGDQQLEFLTSELTALKRERDELKRAVVLAVHHPPIAKDEFHPGTLGLSEDIDKACRAAELWPDVILSGHVHIYQRFTRTIDGIELPYIVSGSGGHEARRPKPDWELQPPPGFTMPVGPTRQFGYLTVTVDMSEESKKLTVTFNSTATNKPLEDSITLDLATRKLV
jgi:predicted phosphodiesterase